MRRCPFCAEEIQDAATICRYCGRGIVVEQDGAPRLLTVEERSAILDEAIRAHGRPDMRVEVRTAHQAVLVYGTKPNHVAHFLIGILTCTLWWVVWLAIAVTSREERRVITVDQYGQVDVRTPSGTTAPPVGVSPVAPPGPRWKVPALVIGAPLALLVVAAALSSLVSKKAEFHATLTGGPESFHLTNDGMAGWLTVTVEFAGARRCSVGAVPAGTTVVFDGASCISEDTPRSPVRPTVALVDARLSSGVNRSMTVRIR